MNIPVKPSNVTYTDDQWKAIWTTGQDTLVSAAAGSGKTRVLITRMIEKVLNESQPVNVDELLVVTFTNAAAAEMRQRMAEALEEQIEKKPQSTHLRQQLNLLNRAQISTLHAYCQHVVRQYAYLLDIDPGFRVADSSETALLKDDALREVLETAYSAANPEELYRLVDSFTTDRDDQLIETLVSQLYEYSRVHPQPKEWLAQIPAQYEIDDETTIDRLSFIGPLKRTIQYSLEEAIALNSELKRIAEMPDGPEPLLKTAEADLLWINEALRKVLSSTWEDVYSYFQTLKWERAASIKKGLYDEDLTARAKKLRDQVKDVVNDVKEAYFIRKPERLLTEIAQMKQPMDTLIELVYQFGQQYEQLKIARGIVDFSDLEHYALSILSEEQNGQLVPSDIAKAYQQQFEEVLVDEYQDTNRLQETIIQLIKRGTEENGNLFMVGDVKQSIYGFRLAEPNLFLEKYEAFTTDQEQSGLRIDLNANFRSRQEVLDATNFIFTQVMGVRVGGIEYDESASLKYGAKYPEKSLSAKMAILYEESEEEESYEEVETGQSLKNVQAEARYIAQQIKQLKENGAEVTDAFTDQKRPVEYRDFVILMRSMTWSGEMVEELKKAGIPVYAEVSKGYFEAIEVMIMLNVLRVIDNPYQDIPLVSMLRSPFIGLKENELAKIRLAAPKEEPYFEALKRFVATGGSGIEPSTQEKLQRFFQYFETWRNLARHGSLADLIWQVYTDTYYYEMVGTMPNGKQRQANLRMLHDRAIDYEQTSFRGLFRFLRFVDRMKRRGDDFGEARALTEQEDVVRIMTIHASKGLEFPYVFVGGVGRKFNDADFKARYLFDQHFGLAVKAIDPENRITYTSLPYLAMREKKKLEMREEEMRVLYVALTRAKEQLYLVASVKKIENEMQKWMDAQLVEPSLMLPEYTRSRANRYIDWIGPALARHVAFDKFDVLPGGQLISDVSKWDISMFPYSMFADENQQIVQSEEEVEGTAESTLKEDDWKKVQHRFNWSYDYTKATLTRSKTSVSDMKRINALEQNDPENALPQSSMIGQKEQAYLHEMPAFMQKRTITAAEIGTAVHAIMQQVPFRTTYDIEEIELFIQSLVKRQLITEEEARAVSPELIMSFFQTSIAERLVAAQHIYRELPFTYAYEGSGEAQILQGIADCLFLEEGGWVLLDYKTDRIQGVIAPDQVEGEMAKRYAVQLSLYKEALESILQIDIKETLLYLFDNQQVIRIGEDLTV